MDTTPKNELLPCPFCGSAAVILVSNENYEIVGCSNRFNQMTSMLCPNPSILVHYSIDVATKYKWWNQRTNIEPA
jgi:hypothetical protein